MSKLYFITKEQKHQIFAEEQRTGKLIYEWVGEREIDGRLYSIYKNKRTHEEFASPQVRTVYMGFNSNEEGKVEEFIQIVEKEGECLATWGVTGRTMHEILARRLAEELPQYKWEIGYEFYECKATKR